MTKHGPCQECNEMGKNYTCHLCMTGSPTPNGYNPASKAPEKDGLYHTICMVGSFDKEIEEYRSWYKNGTWTAMDWATVLAWKEI